MYEIGRPNARLDVELWPEPYPPGRPDEVMGTSLADREYTSSIPFGGPPSAGAGGHFFGDFPPVDRARREPERMPCYGRFFSYFCGFFSNFARHIGQQKPTIFPFHFVLKRGSTLLPSSTGHVS